MHPLSADLHGIEVDKPPNKTNSCSYLTCSSQSIYSHQSPAFQTSCLQRFKTTICTILTASTCRMLPTQYPSYPVSIKNVNHMIHVNTVATTNGTHATNHTGRQ